MVLRLQLHDAAAHAGDHGAFLQHARTLPIEASEADIVKVGTIILLSFNGNRATILQLPPSHYYQHNAKGQS